MARSLNQVTLMGNLTRDPELRTIPSGQNVCSLSLALNRSYKDAQDQWQEATDYVDIVAWGNLADRVSTYLHKGSRCLVQGRLQSRSWEQPDGTKRSKLEVLASDITFLDGRGQESQTSDEAVVSSSAKSKTSKKDQVVEEVEDEPINLDDIPF